MQSGDGKHRHRNPRYDFALSFAGEDRPYVEEVAQLLKNRGVRVFYDVYEEASLWGKDLYVHLRDVYENQARFTIMFISNHYATKLWTNHERQSAQARAFEENREYILPARFDDSEVSGILRTVGYIDLRSKSPNELCDLAIQKLQESKQNDWDIPKRLLISDKLNYPDYPQYSFLSASLFNDGKHSDLTIAIDPTQYSRIGNLLDDLFIFYLSEYLNPFTYGSEWLLTGAWNNHLILPWEWVLSPEQPVHKVAPDWQSAVSPSEAGIIAGSYWRIVAIQKSKGKRKGIMIEPGLKKAYVAGCNNDDISQILLRNPKAIAFLKDDGCLVDSPIAAFSPNEYKSVYVFKDWLSRCTKGALLDSGKEVSPKLKSIFM